MTYVCLKEHTFEAGPYTLVSLRHQDILDIKRWRNAQVDILRQHRQLTDEMQEEYYRNVILPSLSQKEPPQILFSFLNQGACIGYGGLVHIDWDSRRAEVSFLLDDQRATDQDQYRHDFSIFLEMIKKISFDHLHFHRIYTETFDMRPRHIAILEEHGFIFEGRMKDHVCIKGHYIDSIIHGYVKDE